MKLALAFLAVALLAWALAWQSPAWVAERDARAVRVAAVEAARAEADAARVEALAPVRVAVEAGLWICAILGALVALGWAASCAALDVRRRAVAVLPTRDGRIPVPYVVLPEASVRALELRAGADRPRLIEPRD